MSGLLENILKESGLEYLSDLRGKMQSKRIKAAIFHIAVSEYEVEEWTEAVDYLSGVHCDFHSADEVQSYIDSLE